MVAEYEGCRLLLVDKKISTARDIVGESFFVVEVFEFRLSRAQARKGEKRLTFPSPSPPPKKKKPKKASSRPRSAGATP